MTTSYEETHPDLIRDLPNAVKPMTRLMQIGAEGMKASELLSLVFRSRSMRKIDDILKERRLDDLLTMNWLQLAAVAGITEAGAAVLVAACELAQRVNKQNDKGWPTVQTTQDIVGLASEIRDKKKEYLLAFFLNARHQLIAREIISIGTLTASLAHPREIFSPAIGKAAAGVILAHNHPSGDPSPSDEDVRLTRRIAQAGQIMGIELLDHVIVSEFAHYSFKVGGQI